MPASGTTSANAASAAARVMPGASCSDAMASATGRRCGGLGTGAMSATIKRATASGCVSAACIAALPPIECPSSVAGNALIASSVRNTSIAMLP